MRSLEFDRSTKKGGSAEEDDEEVEGFAAVFIHVLLLFREINVAVVVVLRGAMILGESPTMACRLDINSFSGRCCSSLEGASREF